MAAAADGGGGGGGSVRMRFIGTFFAALFVPARRHPHGRTAIAAIFTAQAAASEDWDAEAAREGELGISGGATAASHWVELRGCAPLRRCAAAYAIPDALPCPETRGRDYCHFLGPPRLNPIETTIYFSRLSPK
eukprot:SAG11_NODE_1212_length_5506_cov_3.818384_3_plen_134_part_00